MNQAFHKILIKLSMGVVIYIDVNGTRDLIPNELSIVSPY